MNHPIGVVSLCSHRLWRNIYPTPASPPPGPGCVQFPLPSIWLAGSSLLIPSPSILIPRASKPRLERISQDPNLAVSFRQHGLALCLTVAVFLFKGFSTVLLWVQATVLHTVRKESLRHGPIRHESPSMQCLHFLGSRAPLSCVFLYSSVRAYTHAAFPSSS